MASSSTVPLLNSSSKTRKILGPPLSSKASALAQEGNHSYTQKRYDAAAEAYRQALMHDPSSPLIQYNLGTSLARLGQDSEAEKALIQSAQASAGFLQSDAYYNLGVTFAQPQKPTTSTLSTTQTVQMDPAEQMIKRFEQSLDAFRQSILTDPDNLESKYNYELVQRYLEQLKQQQNQSANRDNKDDQQKDQDQQQDSEQNQKNGQKDQDKQQDQNQKPDQQPKQNESDSKDQSSSQKDQHSKANDDQSSQKPSPTPTPSSAQEQQQSGEEEKNGTQGANAQNESKPLSNKEMDALRLLNLLEQEHPEQFKQLFKFQGQNKSSSKKDW